MPVVTEEQAAQRRRRSPWVPVLALVGLGILIVLVPAVHEVETGFGPVSICGVWLPESDMRDVFVSSAQYRAWAAAPGFHVGGGNVVGEERRIITLRLGSLTWAIAWN